MSTQTKGPGRQKRVWRGVIQVKRCFNCRPATGPLKSSTTARRAKKTKQNKKRTQALVSVSARKCKPLPASEQLLDMYFFPVDSASHCGVKPGGRGAGVDSLDWVLPVLIQGQMQISQKGAVGTGKEGGGVGGGGGRAVRAGCFGLLSAAYNLIWSDCGMLPRAGSSLGSECRSLPTPLSAINRVSEKTFKG